jgi:hypothetical protein
VRAACRGVRDGLSDGDEVDRGWRLEVGLRELMFPGGYEEDQSAPLKCMQPLSTNEEEGEKGDSELVAMLALNGVGATRVQQRAQARSTALCLPPCRREAFVRASVSHAPLSLLSTAIARFRCAMS